jgi:hypothetical protein
MLLKPGARLQSAVCAGQVVVVRAPSEEVDLRFGGVPVRPASPDGPTPDESASPDRVGETPIGKRYVAPSVGLEVLVTKAGSSLLSVGDDLLERKDAKALPASD